MQIFTPHIRISSVIWFQIADYHYLGAKGKAIRPRLIMAMGGAIDAHLGVTDAYQMNLS